MARRSLRFLLGNEPSSRKIAGEGCRGITGARTRPLRRAACRASQRTKEHRAPRSRFLIALEVLSQAIERSGPALGQNDRKQKFSSCMPHLPCCGLFLASTVTGVCWRTNLRRRRHVPNANTLQAWTLDRVITQLPRLGRFDQGEPLDALSDQRDALRQALRQALLTSEGHAQLNAAVMLLKLQDRAGRDAFLETLGGGDAGAKSAMDFGLAPHDSRYCAPLYIETTVPLSAAEIFAAIAPYLNEPQSELGSGALFICLKHDIEASRLVTRPLL